MLGRRNFADYFCFSFNRKVYCRLNHLLCGVTRTTISYEETDSHISKAILNKKSYT